MIKRLLEKLGYYKIEDLQHWGHCGLCGASMEGVFEIDWAYGLCEKCKVLYGHREGEGI